MLNSTDEHKECRKLSAREKRINELAVSVAKDIPEEVSISRVGRGTVFIKSGRVYPVTHSVIKPFTEAVVALNRTVKISTSGLSIFDVNKIAEVIESHDAVVDIRFPVKNKNQNNNLVCGEIIIKGGK